MAKKWTDFTRREKVIGVLVAVFAVISIGGISSAMSGGSSVQTPTPAAQTVTPVTTYEDIEETEVIAFSKETKDDSSLGLGTNKVTTVGVDGVKTKTYRATLVDGVEKARELKSEVVTIAPVNEVTS